MLIKWKTILQLVSIVSNVGDNNPALYGKTSIFCITSLLLQGLPHLARSDSLRFQPITEWGGWAQAWATVAVVTWCPFFCSLDPGLGKQETDSPVQTQIRKTGS
ncbi:hypothetical protein GOODEAATRI_006458 [Goodea atripinnis]|uniref:Uncharacterized protein n=1 Tax=Goodea atripinnis TaxID=208336 RepID=A0ABV0PLC3_9TELE